MSDSSSKILSIRLQKELLVQLDNQAHIQKLTLSDFVRQELSLVEKRIRDNELLKNKMVILLRQIYGAVKERGKSKIDLSKYQELQIHSEKIKEERDEAIGKVSLLLDSNEQIKNLLDHKDKMIQRYEGDKSSVVDTANIAIPHEYDPSAEKTEGQVEIDDGLPEPEQERW